MAFRVRCGWLWTAIPSASLLLLPIVKRASIPAALKVYRAVVVVFGYLIVRIAIAPGVEVEPLVRLSLGVALATVVFLAVRGYAVTSTATFPTADLRPQPDG